MLPDEFACILCVEVFSATYNANIPRRNARAPLCPIVGVELNGKLIDRPK